MAKKFQPTIDEEKCIHCLTCVSICPQEVFEEKEGKLVVAHPEKCDSCKKCVEACPVEAITVEEV